MDASPAKLVKDVIAFLGKRTAGTVTSASYRNNFYVVYMPSDKDPGELVIYFRIGSLLGSVH